MARKNSGRRHSKAAKSRPTQSARRTIRIVAIVLAAVLLLYLLAGLIGNRLGPDSAVSSSVGEFGRNISSALFTILGWMSFALLLTGGVLLAGSLLRQRPWRRFSSAVLFMVGLLIAACLVSWQAGAVTANNFGGRLGALAAGGISHLLGLAGYIIPFLLFFWGRELWCKERRLRSGLAFTGYSLLAGLYLLLAIGQFSNGVTWRLPDDVVYAPSGIAGQALIVLLHRLIGGFGTLLLLLAVLAVGVGLFTDIRFDFPGRLLRRLFARREKQPPVKTPGPSVEPTTVDGATIATTETEPSIPAAEPESGPDGKPARPPAPTRPRPLPRRRPMRDFDLSKFQQAFLDQLDRPGPEDGQLKDPRQSEREAKILLDKLREFGITGRISAIESGPMVTRFELEPAPGIKVQRIGALNHDLALALSAESIRILAPIPGKSAVGIEIPNKNRLTVYLREIITSEAFTVHTGSLGFALGTDITGEPYCADVSKMPHILIAGTTGSGKSVCINSIIASIIYRSSYRQVRLLCIDPKQLELPIYNSIPHLLNRTTTDPKKAVEELNEIVRIMEVRYGEFANFGVRDIASYNKRAVQEGHEPKPYIIVIIDELADLMLRAPTEIEERITRLAQMSRAVGIHLVLATQRPSVDVITGLIKANFPCRVAFQVASKTDSRTILDMNGAEALLGRGDMLFLPPGRGDPTRLHGSFISADAAIRVVNLWTIAYLTERLTGRVEDPESCARQLVEREVVDIFYDPAKRNIRRKREALYEILPEEVADVLLSEEYYDPLPEVRSGALDEHQRREKLEARTLDERIEDAARIVVRHKEASVSMLQRRLDIGWARAGRIIDQLEEAGIVGPYVGSKSRKVLVDNETQLAELFERLHQPQDNATEVTESPPPEPDDETGAVEPEPEEPEDREV